MIDNLPDNSFKIATFAMPDPPTDKPEDEEEDDTTDPDN